MAEPLHPARLHDPGKNQHILGTLVDATSYEEVTDKIMVWASAGESRYICTANVHMIMEGFDDPEFAQVVNGADVVTPDGMPLVWALRRLGIQKAERVCGPALTINVCEAAAFAGIPVGLYGGSEETLMDFKTFLLDLFPQLRVACSISPPFRALTSDEEDAYVRQIVASGARILFVGIGCPKQERWMAGHQRKISAVMIGVGAAFDFHSGRVKRAPPFMQRHGLEWLFRLCMEPRRLWKRYLIHNSRFVWFLTMQLSRTQRRMGKLKQF